MGREAHLMRVALGRSALEPPDTGDGATPITSGRAVLIPQGSQAAETLARGIGSYDNPVQLPRGGQLYDARGNPINPWARAQSRQMRRAQNDILSVIGVTERKYPVDGSLDLGHPNDSDYDPEDEDTFGDLIGNAADFEYQITSWWVHALTNRLLVFPPTSSDLTFVDVVKLHFTALGCRKFFIGGLPSFFIGHLINPEVWAQFVLYFLDRGIMANISSREHRQQYTRTRPLIIGAVEVLLNVFVLPFRLQSMLQLLGFEPQHWLQLPPLRSWIPFCGTSLIQWNKSLLIILPYFAFRPISSVVHQYIFMSCRPAIMEPMNLVRRRSSSGARWAASVNAAPLLELPNVDTALTGVFKKLFNFLGWGHPSYRSETPTSTFQPGLRRRETWPVDHSANAASEEPAPEDESSPIDDAGAVDESPDGPPAPLSRVLTSATLDNGFPGEHLADDTSDATIRVASIDPETGAVNLEIGLPEDVTSHHDNGAANDAAGQEDNTHSAATASRSNRDTELFRQPHRVSRLSLEPTEFLASLANVWVAGWLLMPLRASILRQLIKHVLARPALFGLDAAHAAMLPQALGSSAGMLSKPLLSMTGAGHVALSCMLDVALGMGYWLAEWGVVRWVGIEFYDWGAL